MQYNENMSEGMALLAVLAPANQSAAAHTIGPFNMEVMRRILCLVNIGTLGASATITFKLQASTTSGGTYADIPNSAITQISSGSTNFVMLELRAETLMNNAIGPWVQAVLTVGTAASQVSVEILGSCARYKPDSDYSLVTPTQILVV